LSPEAGETVTSSLDDAVGSVNQAGWREKSAFFWFFEKSDKDRLANRWRLCKAGF
jgi:hypothetical protein